LPKIDDKKDYKYSLQFPKGDKVGEKNRENLEKIKGKMGSQLPR
jgi:hypothetical protein